MYHEVEDACLTRGSTFKIHYELHKGRLRSATIEKERRDQIGYHDQELKLLTREGLSSATIITAIRRKRWEKQEEKNLYYELNKKREEKKKKKKKKKKRRGCTKSR